MRVVIYGAGGHGRVTYDLLRAQRKIKVVGFLDDQQEVTRQTKSAIPILGGREQLEARGGKRRFDGVVLAIGDGLTRERLAKLCEQAGVECVGFVHPSATVSKQARLGAGTVVFPQAVVNVAATIGDGVIINTAAVVEHDAVVGDYAFVAPGAVLCGFAKIGRRTWIGAGAVVVQERSVGDDTLIGAGAVVAKDIPSRVKAYGVPCQVR